HRPRRVDGHRVLAGTIRFARLAALRLAQGCVALPSAQKFCDPSDALAQVVVTEREGETCVARSPKGLTGHEGLFRLLEQDRAEREVRRRSAAADLVAEHTGET